MTATVIRPMAPAVQAWMPAVAGTSGVKAAKPSMMKPSGTKA